MKNEKFKQALKESFEEKAPASFTQGVMRKIEADQLKHQALLPKSVLGFIIGGFMVICFFLILVQPAKELPFTIPSYTDIYTSIIPILILPLVVMSLLFLKNLFYFLKVNKH